MDLSTVSDTILLGGGGGGGSKQNNNCSKCVGKVKSSMSNSSRVIEVLSI